MTLNEALKIYGIEQSELTKENLRKKFRELAKTTHPDLNNGQDCGFNLISEAYDILSKYLNNQDNDETELYTDSNSKYYIILIFLISSDIFGIDPNYNDTEIADIYEKLSILIDKSNNSSDKEIEEYIKETMIKIFKIKYQKSFDTIGIPNPKVYFERLNSEQNSIDDVYIKLCYRYGIKFNNYFRQCYYLAKGYFKEDETLFHIIKDYITYIFRNGKPFDRLEFIKYLKEKIITVPNQSTEEDNNTNLIQVETSEKRNSSPIKENDIVYGSLLIPLELGIVVRENGILVVKYYIYARTDDKIFTEKFTPGLWKKVDDFIDNGFLTNYKIVKSVTRKVDIDKNILVYNNEKYLIADADYSKFAITYDPNKDNEFGNYQFISMWPDFTSKGKLKKQIRENVMKKVFPDEYSELPQNSASLEDSKTTYKLSKK